MNWLILPLLLMVTLTVSALPPPVPQVTADCDHPTYASDVLVCSDTELGELDKLLAQRIAELNGAGESVTVDESDEDWFRRSRMCAFESNHRYCLLRAYCVRIGLLSDATTDSPSVSKPATPALSDICLEQPQQKP